ncbi:unnamed protein product [Xylocopa violacea]|uniref:Uncharacterized protein n=1 Tax=Xylocopa violacea TaxID=135666 RepID=A0ABP1NYV2_XYLVO
MMTAATSIPSWRQQLRWRLLPRYSTFSASNATASGAVPSRARLRGTRLRAKELFKYVAPRRDAEMVFPRGRGRDSLDPSSNRTPREGERAGAEDGRATSPYK